jgi:hypothetical protein
VVYRRVLEKDPQWSSRDVSYVSYVCIVCLSNYIFTSMFLLGNPKDTEIRAIYVNSRRELCMYYTGKCHPMTCHEDTKGE